MVDHLRISTKSTDWKTMSVAGVQAAIQRSTAAQPTLLLPRLAQLRSAIETQVRETPG
jgi:hypothetical protein